MGRAAIAGYLSNFNNNNHPDQGRVFSIKYMVLQVTERHQDRNIGMSKVLKTHETINFLN